MKITRIATLCSVLMFTAVPVVVTGCDSVIHKYDTLVDKDEKANAAWSNYESQLQRRADLIPSMVNIVKGSAAHEENTLREVMEARASATQLKLSSEDLSDPDKVAQFQKVQNELKGSLSRLMMVQENYPDLKANSQFHDLMITLEGTENRLLRARGEYNKAVTEYNTELRHVSGKAINPLTNSEFKPRVYFKMDPGAEKAPTIDFSKQPKAASSGSSGVK